MRRCRSSAWLDVGGGDDDDVVELEALARTIALQAERTRAIFDSVLVGIVTVGAGGIEWMNRSAQRMFGGSLADFLDHRIKNNLQGVAGLLQQIATKKPEVSGAIDEVVGQVQANRAGLRPAGRQRRAAGICRRARGDRRLSAANLRPQPRMALKPPGVTRRTL